MKHVARIDLSLTLTFPTVPGMAIAAGRKMVPRHRPGPLHEVG
jgi:hypothetical protein